MTAQGLIVQPVRPAETEQKRLEQDWMTGLTTVTGYWHICYNKRRLALEYQSLEAHKTQIPERPAPNPGTAPVVDGTASTAA